jgi:hypothetical protein
MPVQDNTFCNRMVKRVTNAIHNPAVSSKDVYDTIKDLHHNHIIVYKEDYDDWINEAIRIGSGSKLFVVLKALGKNCPDILTGLLNYSPHTIPRFVASRIFCPDRVDHEVVTFITLWKDPKLSLVIDLFFKQPRTASVILRLANNRWFSKAQQTHFMRINPVLEMRKKQRKILTRFWLLTFKKVLGMWRETLYVPGTGALYKKALTSFISNTV